MIALNKKKLIIIALVCVGILILLGFLLFKYFAPFGKVVSYTFTSKLPGAQDATTFPTAPASSLKIPSQIIKTGQVRFSINLLSRDIESIQAKLRFKKNTREIKIGVRGNETDSFTYLPLYQSQLQDLAWPQINDSGFTLWQKAKTFSGIGNFINNVSPEKKTASYFVDFDKLSLLKPAPTSGDVHTLVTGLLRGTHTFLVRVDKAPLILNVTKQDMNAYEGEDKVKIVVTKDGKSVAEQTIADDGITTASNLKMQPQETTITVTDIKPGLYKTDLFVEGKGGDSLITKIDVNQKKVVFENYIFILGDKPSTLWINSKNISISTLHEAGKQTVKLNGNVDLKIAEVEKKYVFDLEQLSGNKASSSSSSLYKLEFPKNDLVVNYDGYIVFNKDNYFEPDIIKTVPLMTLDTLDDVDYVLATYQKAKQDGDWMVAEATFDPKDIKITGDKLYFSLEIPDLAKSGGELEIDSLEVEATSKGLLSKVLKNEPKNEAKPASVAGQKTNVFSRTFSWVGEKATAVKNSIGGALSGAWKAVTGFFGGFFQKSTDKKGVPAPTIKISPTPTSLIKVFPTATPTPSIKYDTPLRVLNGGAEKGAAASVSAMLKAGGFSNVTADNADRSDYEDVTIRFLSKDSDILKRLEEILRKEYTTITKIPAATTAAQTTIIVGKK